MLINLSHRHDLPELMDDPDLDPAAYARCIADLAALNRLTLTHRPVLRWLAAVGPTDGFSVLDVAYGDGDLLRAIARWAARHHVPVRLSGIDLNPRSALAARAATPPGMAIDYHTGDVFDFAPATPPDFIVTSQFTHHLDDATLVRLLQWMERHARRGWHVTDLHRHPVPYYGFRYLARLAGWHRIVAQDGTASIARGFTTADWRLALERAGLAARVDWRVPFRHTIARLK